MEARQALVFQYGPGGYELSSAGIFAGQETSGLPFGVEVAGLAPGTTYHVRAVATNELGNAVGTDVTFTTQSLPSSKPAKKKKRKCKKGFVKRKGKCVRTHKKKHAKHHRRSNPRNG